jgi:hypothetical protein
MTNVPSQIKTIGATKTSVAINTISSKESYDCANAQITRGLTGQPSTLAECKDNYPNIATIATALGVDMDNPWSGPPIPGSLPPIHDTLLGNDSDLKECTGIDRELGSSWLGCLWGSPMADFSCTCPDVGANFDKYLKLRLNVATFWNTLVETPAKRSEFLDAIKFAPKTTIVVPGTFQVRPGDVIEIKADNTASYQKSGSSILSKKYYVISVKNMVSSGGVHETAIIASTILP